ncbi:D-glycero-beta-D-manno-heptose 1-phosphate adenylyltransferase [Blastococcus haudaquaticus]|uniref:D-glycero-beta-D-manno-heptose 1-phosphate adenylyltransferase n=1 Tax=Blastococcus haudaquaticus TaxID=1938745 RepID=A0A286GY63_9ACTN|nr:D-glycero-beta-D-manno-heptose 1-phosphate adenylyltransferase [Blastococcus haudaquaticus]SOE00470.1 rfaE bifunctional protein, domain I/rfaE bifunctional protein, domain II [Blastococcus haudaquaticus]
MSGPLVVVGDALLDVDLVGTASRLTPDAPVPVVEDVETRERPGGAALAAVIAAAATSREVVLVAPIDTDDGARRLTALLDGRVRLLPIPASGGTAVKQRVRVGDHSVVRLDSGAPVATLGALPDEAAAAIRDAAAVLVADYGRGTTSAPDVRAALAAAGGPVVWDPHPRGADPVPNARLVTPNGAEAARVAGAVTAAGQGLAAVGARAEALIRTWGVGAVAVTLGARGALLSYGEGAPMVVPAVAVSGGDACGAGDSFAAAAALALADGAVTGEAVAAAVAAASAFVARGGASAWDSDARPEPEPVPAGSSADALLARVRAAGGTVVATGGCFDLLHAGHVATLRAARGLGNCLIVCINSDESVRRLKGPTRPLVSAPDRARVLEALEFVDAVVVFDEDTPTAVLDRLRPDVWAKGGDYAGADLPEAAVLRTWGGQAVVLPYLDGHSTTALVERSQV